MIDISIVLLSFIGILWAANHLVTGASGIANYYKIPPVVIGLTLVAIISSSPEITVAITAAINGQSELALGNAIGTNIANIGLVLGITILLYPLKIKSSLVRHISPLLLIIMLFTYSLMLNGYLGILDSCLLLIACLFLIGYLVYLAKHSPRDSLAKEMKATVSIKRPLKNNLVDIILSLIVLPICGHFLVKSATQLALWSGSNELFIGLTLVAIGTSLPDLVTSLVAAYKGHDDIAVGNILGSNMYNLLIVMAFPGIINPSSISYNILRRDIPMMFLITFILCYLIYRHKKKMERWHGGMLLLIYCCYLTALVVNAIKTVH